MRAVAAVFRDPPAGINGPLSFLALLFCWAASLGAAFGILQWVAGLQVGGARASLADAFYFSGTTLFRVGSPTAQDAASKVLSVSLGLVVG